MRVYKQGGAWKLCKPFPQHITRSFGAMHRAKHRDIEALHRPTHKESGRHAQSQEQKAYKQCIPPSTKIQGAMYTAQYRVVVRHTQGQTLQDMDIANHSDDDDHAQSQGERSLKSHNRQCPNTEWLAMMRRAMPRDHELQCHTQGQIQRECETCTVLTARKP